MQTAPAPGINATMSAGQWGLLVTLSVLWGGSFFFNGIALADLPPVTLVMLRAAFAAVILLVTIRITGEFVPLNRRVFLALLVMGGLNNAAPFMLLAWGQSHVGSGAASILNATSPLWTVLAAHVFTSDEKLTANRLAGVLCGLLGVVALIGPGALAGIGTDVTAQFACIGAAACYALASVFARRFGNIGLRPLSSAAGQSCAALLFLLPISLLVDHPWTLPMPSLSSWLAILGLAVLSTALGYVIYFRILSTSGATNIQLVTFLVPVTAVLLGVFILGEHFDPRDLGGLALIGLGLALIDGRLPRRIGALLR